MSIKNAMIVEGLRGSICGTETTPTGAVYTRKVPCSQEIKVVQKDDYERLVAEHDALAKRVEELEDRLFAAGAMEQAPCFCCGYNGPRYYQPDTHPCAKRHHEMRHGESEI